MVIDTSAVIAMLAAEPEDGAMASMISLAVGRQMSAATYLESAIVVEARYGVPGGQKLDQLIEAAEVRIEPVTVEQATVARIAYRKYGKGNHPAAPNFGDCFAYALAKVSGESLLFVGADFSQTDIPAAVAS